jgi:thiol-disulfide isomerase/thioredoxin
VVRFAVIALLAGACLYGDDIAEMAARVEELARKEAPLPRYETARRAEAMLAQARPDLAARFRALEADPVLVDVPQPLVMPALPSGGRALEDVVARLVEEVEHNGDDPGSYDALAAIIRQHDLAAGLDNASIRARIALADLNDLLHPDYVLTGLDGRKVRLSEYRGKTVLLTFWATWCIPCRAELARLEKVRATSHTEVLAISHEDPEVVRKFLAAHPYRLPVYIDAGHKLSDRLHIDTIPATLTMGADGRLERVE